MKSAGFNVHEATTVSEARDHITESSFDAAILDDEMGDDTGLSLISPLLQRNPNAKIVVYSAYKVPEDRSAIVRMFELPNEANLIVVSKTQARVSTGSFGELMADVYEACHHDKRLNERLGPKRRRIRKFAYSYNDYERMSPLRRKKLHNSYVKDREKSISSHIHSEGVIWALFFGDEDIPAAIARSPNEIWDYRKVDQEARSRDKMPFQVAANDLSEDAEGACGYPQLANYPTLAFDFVGNEKTDGSTLKAHVDTGTLDVFFNGKYLLENGIISEAPATFPKTVNGDEVEVFRWSDAKVSVQNSGRNSDTTRPDINVSAWVVMSEWSDVSLFARCRTARNAKSPFNHECGNSEFGDVCVFRRQAFFGRSLFTDTEFDFAVCGKTAQVSLVRS